MDTTPKSVLSHYGQKIPDAVARAAKNKEDVHGRQSERVVQLRESDGCQLGDDIIGVYVIGDGALVGRGDWGSSTNTYRDWWAMEAGVIMGCVGRLARNTDFVVVDGDEAYTPEFDESVREIPIPPSREEVMDDVTSDGDDDQPQVDDGVDNGHPKCHGEPVDPGVSES